MMGNLVKTHMRLMLHTLCIENVITSIFEDLNMEVNLDRFILTRQGT